MTVFDQLWGELFQHLFHSSIALPFVQAELLRILKHFSPFWKAVVLKSNVEAKETQVM